MFRTALSICMALLILNFFCAVGLRNKITLLVNEMLPSDQKNIDPWEIARFIYVGLLLLEIVITAVVLMFRQ